MQALAVKYRPKVWSDVVEQGYTKQILENQLERNEIKNGYLFTGPAGCGKTTCARIFAHEINKGLGNPIEMDAASHSSVDDVRDLITQAQTKSLTSEYKVFIVDECHSLSNTAWQALLKLLEEPPEKSIFIFCTTDSQKIPKTILSRIQRYDFKCISFEGICNRLGYICQQEQIEIEYSAIEFIAKQAEGGLRDSITMLDKCQALSNGKVTLDVVLNSIGGSDYTIMKELTDSILAKDEGNAIRIIEELHNEGKDLKLFISRYIDFLLDVQKFDIFRDFEFIKLPRIYEDWLQKVSELGVICLELLRTIVKLNSDIKWNSSPKYFIESVLLLFCRKD